MKNRYVVDNRTGWIGIDEGEAETKGWRSIRYLNQICALPMQQPSKSIMYLNADDIAKLVRLELKD